MILTGHGRPLGAFALAALVLLSFVPGAPAASRGNVVEATMPAPKSDQVVLTRLEAEMQLRPRGGGPVGRLSVRRAGRVPAGFAVAAVRARQRGNTVIVRIAAVRTSGSVRAGRLRVRVRIGGSRVTYRRAVTSTVPIGPATSVRGTRDCRTIDAEASRWTPVRGLAAVSGDGVRFGARTAVAAAMGIACDRRIRTVSGTESFLVAVDEEFSAGGSAVEGFYATWARDAAGNARICVYIRGRRGGDGDVTVASTTQAFELGDTNGVARTDTAVAGEGEYAFVVRWRQPDGTVRESESTLRVPAGGMKGNDPPEPYSAAGPCG